MRRSSIWWGGLGQPFAIFALLCQLVSVVLAVPGMFAAELVADFSVICHSDSAATPATDKAPRHRPATCPLCPLWQEAALTALTPVSPAVEPPLRQGVSETLPPIRAGPTLPAVHVAAQPRGPPAPV